MEEFPSNSNKSKEIQQPEKHVEKVVSGTAKIRKRSGAQKLTDIFVPGDVENVKHYILTDVIVPAVKKAIVDVVSDGVNMLMYGESGSHKSNSVASKVSYRNFYDQKNNNRERYSSIQTRTGYSYDNIVLESRGEAEDVLTRMDELLATYGMVSVADMYDLCGVTPQYTDNNYGWTNIRNAQIVRIRDGYVIKMPKPMPLD
jgi:hypothetical protein